MVWVARSMYGSELQPYWTPGYFAARDHQFRDEGNTESRTTEERQFLTKLEEQNHLQL